MLIIDCYQTIIISNYLYPAYIMWLLVVLFNGVRLNLKVHPCHIVMDGGLGALTSRLGLRDHVSTGPNR